MGVFVRDVGPYDGGVQGLEDPTGLNVSDALPKSASSSSKDVNAQNMSPRGPVKRGSEPTLKAGIPSPKPVKRSMSELASTIRVKPTRTLSKLNLAGGGSGVGSSNNNFFTPSSRSGSPIFTTPPRSKQLQNDPDTLGGLAQDNNMTEYEKKKSDLQMRVYKARAQIPPQIYLRIFRHPEECVEASEIMDTLHVERS